MTIAITNPEESKMKIENLILFVIASLITSLVSAHAGAFIELTEGYNEY